MILHMKKSMILCSLLIIALTFSKTAQAAKSKSRHSIEFLAPVHKAPQGDPFEYKDIKGVSGEIAYSYGIHLVVRTVKEGKQIKILTTTVKNGSPMFDVQLSPDGRYVLFKEGTYGGPYDVYSLYYWDLKTQKVLSVPVKNITYYRVDWSPSGRYIAYCLGGDVNGFQYGVAGMNRPLRLYTYDTQTGKTHFIAEGQHVTGWVWTHDDKLLYGQAEQDRKWVEGSNKKMKPRKPELANTYVNSPLGGKGRLIIKNDIPLAVSPDGTRLLLGAYYNPKTPADKRKKPTNTYLFYGNRLLYNTQNKKNRPIDIGQFTDARFLDNTTILLSIYDYVKTTGTLTITKFNTESMTSKDVGKVSETDSEATPNRAPFTPQFGFFRLSKDKQNLFFYSEHQGKKIGKNRFLFPLHLNLVNLEDNTKRVICKTNWATGISWSSVYRGER